MRWLRLLLTALLLAPALLGGALAQAGESGHHCDAMSMSAGMDMQDCHKRQSGDREAVPDCAAALLCGMGQILPPSSDAFLSSMALVPAASISLRDDLLRRGLAGPPDLRPPIG